MDSTDVSGVTEDNLESKIVDDGLPKTQEKLNELIGKEKLLERDKIRREMEAKHKAEIERLRAEQSKSVEKSVPSNSNVAPELDESVVDSRVEQALLKRQKEAEEKAREAAMENVADTFFTKMDKGKEAIPDFEEVMGDFDYAEFPHLVHAASGLDNAAHVMYELANDPRKLEKIVGWLKTMPSRGMKELQKLSASIRETEAAVDEYQPTAPPLSQTKPSNVSAGSGLSRLEQLKQSGRFRF